METSLINEFNNSYFNYNNSQDNTNQSIFAEIKNFISIETFIDTVLNSYDETYSEQLEEIKSYNHECILEYVFSNDINTKFGEHIFKNSNQYNFFSKLFNIFDFSIESYLSISYNKKYNILYTLLSINRGQYLISRIPFNLLYNKLKTDDRIRLYFAVGISGTLPTFLIIDKKFTKKNFIDFSSKSILSASCRNGDDRVIKYIIKNFEKYQFPTNNNEKFIKCLISNIFSEHIPQKYILRRLKLINTKINLSPFYVYMLRYINDFDTLIIIDKYYNNSDISFVNNQDFNFVSFINNWFYNYNSSNIDDEFKINLDKLSTIFKTNIDKLAFSICIFNKFYNLFNLNPNDYYHENFLNNKVIKELLAKFSVNLCNTNDIFNVITKSKVNKINSLLTSIGTSGIYWNEGWCMTWNNNDKTNLFFMLPFINTCNIKYQKFNKILINMCLIKFHIKLWMRKQNKILKIYKTLESIDSNKIKYNCPFTKLPARHLVPFELNNIKNNKTNEGLYLIREKADGCLVEFIPNMVEPFIKTFTQHNIKAEFIEDLDLYLIFDINIEMSAIDRYDMLRNSHPDTVNTKPLRESVVSTFDELKEEIKLERERFNTFLSKPYENYRVYPKATWLVKDSNKLNSELVFNIIEEKDKSLICNEGYYTNDGLIITPLDGSRELKIKPKSMHTLDLIYNNGWFDREGNSWNHIIKSTKKFKMNKIWRCYPLFVKSEDNHMMYEPREYRYDKTKPNTNKVVKMIYSLHMIDWNKVDSSGFKLYYQSANFKSKNWHEIIERQNDNLTNMLIQMKPNVKSKWLDLGCGSGRLLKFLKKFMIDSYLGIDFDINQLNIGMKFIDFSREYSQNSRLVHADLSGEWNKSNISWDYIDSNEKYDYVVSNFSLVHYYNDTFWSKLNNITNKCSKFLFSIVNENIKNKWSYLNDYMYMENEIVYYFFESVHLNRMQERFIPKEKLKRDFESNGWKIDMVYTPVGNSLDSKYSWYIVTKN